MPFCCSTAPAGHHRQTESAQEHHANLPAAPRAGAEPRRERLAVSAPELALKSRLRRLRRHHRRRVRGLARAHRTTKHHHINRNARMGSRRSIKLTVGISRLVDHMAGPIDEIVAGDAAQERADRHPRRFIQSAGRSFSIRCRHAERHFSHPVVNYRRQPKIKLQPWLPHFHGHGWQLTSALTVSCCRHELSVAAVSTVWLPPDRVPNAQAWPRRRSGRRLECQWVGR